MHGLRPSGYDSQKDGGKKYQSIEKERGLTAAGICFWADNGADDFHRIENAF